MLPSVQSAGNEEYSRYVEGEGGTHVLNKRNLRLLEVRKVIHHHDTAMRILLEIDIIGVGSYFRNIVMLWSIVGILCYPGDLCIKNEHKGDQIIFFRFFRF